MANPGGASLFEVVPVDRVGSGHGWRHSLYQWNEILGSLCFEGFEGVCVVCGVGMDLCEVCGGVGYHRQSCAEIADMRDDVS